MPPHSPLPTDARAPSQRASQDVRTPPADATPAPEAAAPRGPAWWRALRPRQWPKNLLVLAAPLAGGRILDAEVVLGAGVALVVFCLAASGCYLVNDVVDAPHDRLHPTKRLRPVAAGEIRPVPAAALGVVLLLAAVGLGAAWSLALGLTMLVYVVVQALYVAGLKHQATVDLGVVASGFLLRAVAGGVATQTPLSTWFLLVATFGALFVVAGKRYSEHVRLGDEGRTRPSLRHYSASYLRFVWTLAAGVTVVVHLLWALSGEHRGGTPWEAMSVAAFVLALLRYAARVDQGTAEHPEEIVLRDRTLQVLGAAWALLVLLGAVTA